jgi:exocyst complex component 3
MLNLIFLDIINLSCSAHFIFQDVEGMMSISTEAAEARASLKDERELLRTFEALTALEQKRRFALATVSTRREEAGKLTEYFEDVSNTRAKFEQTLWGHIRNFFQLAKERCLFPFSINLRLSQFFKTMPKEMLATIQT